MDGGGVQGFPVVIIADDFSGFLAPISDHMHVMLSPVGNIPVIDYILDFLQAEGAGDVYVISSNRFHDALMGHISTLQMGQGADARDFRVTVVFKEDLQNSVSAIRQSLEDMELTESFLLLDGPMLPSFNVQTAMRRHKAYEAAYGEQYILTNILRLASIGDASSGIHDPTVILRELETGFIKMYEMEHSQEAVNVPVKMIHDKRCKFSSDLVPTNAYICSPIFPQTVRNEYDRKSMYALIRSIITNVIGTTIVGSHILERSECILPIDCMKTFLNASSAYMHGELYPYTPTNPPFAECRHIEKRSQTDAGCVYYAEVERPSISDIDVQPRAHIAEFSIIGKRSAVRTRSLVKNSVLGARCTIDSGVRIYDSIIMNNVHIHANTKIRSAFIMSNADIGKNCVIHPDTVIGANVTVPNSFQSKRGAYLIASKGIEATTSPTSESVTTFGSSADLVSAECGLELEDSSLGYEDSYDANEGVHLVPNMPVLSCPSTPGASPSKNSPTAAAKPCSFVMSNLYENDTQMLKQHAASETGEERNKHKLTHAFSALALMPASSTESPSTSYISNSQNSSKQSSPREMDEQVPKPNVMAQVYTGTPQLTQDGWLKMYKAVAALSIQRVAYSVFFEDIHRILVDVVDLNELTQDKQETLKLDIQGVRLNSNMDHEECYPVIAHAALLFAFEKAGNDLQKLLEESVRMLNLLWPLMDAYIPPELRKSQGYTIEFPYAIYHFVLTQVKDNDWESWTPYVSSLFQYLYNSESGVCCDYENFIQFFDEMEMTSDNDEKAFYGICAQFKEWLTSDEGDEDDGQEMLSKEDEEFEED